MSAAKLAFGAVVIAYPLIVFIGLEHFEARLVALGIVAIALIRLCFVRRVTAAALPQAYPVVLLLLLVGLAATVANSSQLLRYYPVLVNAALLTIFSVSLVRPPTLVERIARLGTPDLPDAAIGYLRTVTKIWCAFFLINGSISLYTVLGAGTGFWALYNGFISYLLMGALFAGEYVARRAFKRRHIAQGGAGGC